jgi:hypothetical protein
MRIHEQEEAILDAKKDEFNMTKSEYLRNLILFAPAGERIKFSSDYASNMIKKINCIGRRINEIAHTVNSRRTIVPVDIDKLRLEYEELLVLYEMCVRDTLKNTKTP